MKPKLIILLDAFGEGYYNKSNYLKELGDIKKVEPVFGYQSPLEGFLSGRYPEESGVWFSFIIDNNGLYRSTKYFLPVIKIIKKIFPAGINLGIPFIYSRFFGITNLSKLPNNLPIDFLSRIDLSFKTHTADKNYPNYNIFSFCREKNISYKFIVANIIFDENGHKIFYFQKGNDDTAKNLFIRNLNKDVNFYFVHLTELDGIGHEYLNGYIVNNVISKEEIIIKEMIDNFLKTFPEGEYIIFGDHGMAPVKNYINPYDIIDYAKNIDKELSYFIDSTFIRIYLSNKENITEIIEILKEKFSHDITLLDDTMFKKYKIPQDRRYGDIIISVKPYGLFYPNFFNDHLIKGMHGYITEIQDAPGCIISNIKIEEKFVRLQELQNLMRK